MEGIANTIKRHIDHGTLDIHQLNILLQPVACLVLESAAREPHFSSFTPIDRGSSGMLDSDRRQQLLAALPSPPYSVQMRGEEKEQGHTAQTQQHVGRERQLEQERKRQERERQGVQKGATTEKEQEYTAQAQQHASQERQLEQEREPRKVQKGVITGHDMLNEPSGDAASLAKTTDREGYGYNEVADKEVETAYPQTLAVNPKHQQPEKRKASDGNPSSTKKPRPTVEKKPRGRKAMQLAKERAGAAGRDGNINCAKEDRAKSDYQVAGRGQFIAHWSPRLGGFSEWERLDTFALISHARASSTPYEDLSRVMRWASVIGARNMHTVFANNIHAWVSSPENFSTTTKLPPHLQNLPDINAAPIQKFWRAVEVSRSRREFEGMATLLTRRAWVEMLSAYQEAVDEIRSDNKKKKVKLASGEKATTKARETLYTLIYPDVEAREEAQKQFNNDQKRATAYHRLCTHYGHSGILALIPKMDDTAFRSTDGMHQALLQVLDIIRPELHQDHVKFYGSIIDTIYGGLTPTSDELTRLSDAARTIS